MVNLSRRAFIKQATVLAILPFRYFEFSSFLNEKMVFPELEIQGSPGQMGMQHGKAFKSLIQKNIQFYKEWITGGDKKRVNELKETSSRFGPILREYVPEQFEEIMKQLR